MPTEPSAAAGTRREPPEPYLRPADVVARAALLSRTLVDLQAETEQRTYYSEETHAAFTEAGLYRILVPRRYGGYEFGAETFLRAATTIARGCPSTGWMYLFGAAHALVVATLFDETAQAELFEVGDFICPAVVAPSGTAERTAAGDWRIDGTWRYCSGAPYATHFIGHAMADGGAAPVLFVVARHQFQRLDDWGAQLGLRGSGSHSIRVEQAVIPDRYVVRAHLSQLDVSGGTPGRTLHRNPEYGGGQLSFMLLELGALALGMAQGALDSYEELMLRRQTAFEPVTPRTEDPDYQFHYGEAVGLIAAAEAALWHGVGQWRELAATAAVTRQEELRLAMVSREVVRLCWRAVAEQMFPTAGSSAVRAGERLERVWRDLSMLQSHAGLGIFLASMANREYSRARFADGTPDSSVDRDPKGTR